MSIKKTLLKSIIFIAVDSYIRSLLNFIPHLDLLFRSKSKPKIKNKYFLAINGGIGDFIPILYLINTLHECQFFILCLPKHKVMENFVHSNVKLELLTFNNIIRNFFIYRETLRDYVHIRTSPIFEFYLLSKLLNIKQQIGYIRSFTHIDAIGYNLDLNIINTKLNVHKNKAALFVDLTNVILNNNNLYTTEIKPIKELLTLNDQKKYILIAPAKSPGWEMGILENKEYINIALDLVSKGYEVAFIGVNNELDYFKKNIKEKSIKFLDNLTYIELSNIIYNSILLISNDNGIAHLAAYLNKDVIVLYTFSDPKSYSWNNTNYHYLFNPIYNCMPCTSIKKSPVDNYEFLCPHNNRCRQSITSNLIINKITHVLT